MRYTDIDLIKYTDGRNEEGDLTRVETRTKVYAGEYSVGMSEVYQGMAVGFKPEVKFLLENWLDYHGEEVIEYVPFGYTETVRLRVLRLYNKGDALEITCYKDNEEPMVPEPEPTPTPVPDPEEDDNADTEISNEDNS